METKILNAKYPWDIFTKDKYKAEYRDLVRKYHPDVYTGDKSIMQKVNELYESAQSFIDNGLWGVNTSFVVLNTAEGKELKIAYVSTYSFELGSVYLV